MPFPVCTVGPKILHKKGRAQVRKPKAVSGFDYPTTQVGTSTWLGSDGKPVTIYYDQPDTGPSGLTVAQFVQAQIDALMGSCDNWFGVKGASGNVIICPDFGGAYHYGCDFTSGGDWYESLDQGGQVTVLGLVMAEVTESYMGLQNLGWNCGGSGGEALSRFLAEVATGGATGAMSAYAAGPSWDGSDWISKDQGTDQDYPSIGCGVLYLWWMVSQGYTVSQIVQAGESDGTLASNYAKLTGKPATQAFTDFQTAIAKIGMPGSYTSDNPWNAANPKYPDTAPTPPPPTTISLTAVPTSGAIPLSVLFSGSSSGAAWSLDFGDGSTPLSGTAGSSVTATHVYTTAGAFTAKLTAGSQIATATVAAGGVTPPPPPTIGFTGSVTYQWLAGALSSVFVGLTPAAPATGLEAAIRAELVGLNPQIIVDVLKLLSDLKAKAPTSVIIADLLKIASDFGS